MDFGHWLSMHHDVGLIETNLATQDGRMKNAKCRPNWSGVSSNAGAGSTKGCFGVQSDIHKNVASEPEREPQSIVSTWPLFH